MKITFILLKKENKHVILLRLTTNQLPIVIFIINKSIKIKDLDGLTFIIKRTLIFFLYLMIKSLI